MDRARGVVSADGTRIAVFETGDPALTTVVAVHGYPDNHTLWDGVVEQLAADYHVVTYDVRGAGASEVPAGRPGYRIPRLVEDLAAVLDATSPHAPAHLLAHDWGSIAGLGRGDGSPLRGPDSQLHQHLRPVPRPRPRLATGGEPASGGDRESAIQIQLPPAVPDPVASGSSLAQWFGRPTGLAH